MGAYRWLLDHASQGRLRQEQLAQTVAMSAPNMPSPDRDQTQYLRAQLAHRDAQLEHVRSERDTQFVQEAKQLAHTRLLSSEAKDWKSRMVSETEQVLVNECAEAAQRANDVQESMDKQSQVQQLCRQAKAQAPVICTSPTAQQLQQLAESLHKSELEHQQLCSLKHKPSECHKIHGTNKLLA